MKKMNKEKLEKMNMSSSGLTHAARKGNCPVDNLIWGAMRHNKPNGSAGELMSELKSNSMIFDNKELKSPKLLLAYAR